MLIGKLERKHSRGYMALLVFFIAVMPVNALWDTPTQLTFNTKCEIVPLISTSDSKIGFYSDADGYADFSVATQDSSATIIKGPYLQNVTENSIVIMWETDEATPSLIEYGTPSTQINEPDSVNIHEVTITGLETGVSYDYRVSVDGSPSLWTDWLNFKTAPDTNQNFRIAVYGDTRTDSASHSRVVQAIINNNPEIVFNTGDLVEKGKCYEDWGSQFFSPAAPLMYNVTFYPILGNHEYYTDENCAYPPYMWYFDFFSLPRNEQWYAFTYGSVRFIGLDTNFDFTPESAQYNWLVDELESSEYKSSNWQFVFFHHPPYTSGISHSGNVDVQNYLVPLFEQYGIDMLFNGHVHNYEQSYKDGIYYIVTGGGGAPLHSFHKNPLSYNPYSMVRVKDYHHVTLDVTSQQVMLTAWFNNGSVFDTFKITKFRKNQSFQDGIYPTLTYTGTKDTYISEENPDDNYGNSATLSVDGDDPPSSGKDKSVILKWNVSSIPPGNVVTYSGISIYVSNPTDEPGYKLYEMKSNWVENEATWNKYSNGSYWQSPGASGADNRGSKVLGTLAPSTTGYYTINLNTDGLALVQSWIDDPLTNHGIIILDPNESNGLDFDSSEAFIDNRPKLVIEYEPQLCPPKPSISISSNKTTYATGETMIITLNIDNPTSNPWTFDWYIGIPQSNTWASYVHASIPPGYSNTHTIPIPIGNWGSSPFGLVHYVHLLDSGTGEVLVQDSALVSYSPTGAKILKLDIAKEIMRTKKKVKLPI
jgi:predicted phosphodiesterase